MKGEWRGKERAHKGRRGKKKGENERTKGKKE